MNGTRRAPFPDQVPRPVRSAAGRTLATETPLAIRTSGVRLDEPTREWVRRRLGRALGRFSLFIDRVSVRFRDLNGPRGGIDNACVIKVVLSGMPSVLSEARAQTPRAAFDRAAPGASKAVRRSLAKASLRTPRVKKQHLVPQRGERPPSELRGALPPEDGSLIGRRVGRSKERLRRVAERPEKLRRDVWVDTAQPGTSATDRKVGAGSTARRNTKLNLTGMTSTLEDSAQDRPSRKSTRKSAGRAKRDTGLRLRATSQAHSPKAHARKARAGRPKRR